MHLSPLLPLLIPLAVAVPQQPYLTNSECTTSNALQRKEWSTLSDDERIAYTDAVTCLMNEPSIYPRDAVPASTSFYTDFAASHANISLSIHQTGTFLSWHREFLSIFEYALHDCGYPRNSGIPYWDWPLYISQPLTDSPLFDDRPPPLAEMAPPSLVVLSLPTGSGGGCVLTDPFANTTVSLGPFPPEYIVTGLPENWTAPNPHYLTRDLNNYTLELFANGTRVQSLLEADNIEDFQFAFNPIHSGGHFSIGGQMADFYVSPLDPTFWLHHAQIDRLWAIWQDEDERRRDTYNGTSTFLDPVGGTPEVDGETVITFVPLGDEITLDEAKDPMRGRYCYQYV
ncbi:hypothetical protein BJX63DRAFT_441162 [Aspergillus granulosus]|uniref:Tyrosinase copper-binding domain-containing protein n=1 Tax=Aspergillus granulosus TaxID=176169 RepID=A0ABR4I3Y8_9EURO